MISREEFEELTEEEQEEMLLRAIKKAYDETGNDVFETEGEFFILRPDNILEMSSDFSEGPKGGYYPDLIHGPEKETEDAIKAIMDKFGIDEEFFLKVYGCPDEYNLDSEEAFDVFDEDTEDEKELKTIEILKKLQAIVKTDETLFNSVNAMASVFETIGLDPNSIYYKWEDCYIDLYENVWDCGEERGAFSGYDDYDWLEVLENLDKYRVR